MKCLLAEKKEWDLAGNLNVFSATSLFIIHYYYKPNLPLSQPSNTSKDKTKIAYTD